MKSQWTILIVDDEDIARESMASWLREDGYTVDTAPSGRDAIDIATHRPYTIYFVDLKMPKGPDGIETMMALRKIHPDASVIIITAYATVDTAITAMKEGAEEYIVKPVNPKEISMLVERIIKIKNLQRENVILKQKLARQYRLNDIISKNPKMLELFDLVREVADLRSTVLIQGESGTGKQLIARAIHATGSRAGKPFISVSCAALAESLLESELFGHERGAFTGAVSQQKGKFELADGGTIFLDEIGDIPAKLQMDLLRVLQDRTFYRVGGSQEVSVDVRVVAATNADLRRAVDEGKFREDLFYRLNVVSIQLPPLRERKEDIPMLARHFIERVSSELEKEIAGITDGGIRILMDHSWPGNVRELENVLERAIISCKSGLLGEEELAFLSAPTTREAAWNPPANIPLEEVERQVIAATLQRTRGNVTEAASILGIDRSTLYDRIKKFRIPRPAAQQD